jgi:hypothetical protein
MKEKLINRGMKLSKIFEKVPFYTLKIFKNINFEFLNFKIFKILKNKFTH